MTHNIIAIYNHPECGYRTAEQLEEGIGYTVTDIRMGYNRTEVYLAGFNEGFDSVKFDFFEDGKPLDIGTDARFNYWTRTLEGQIAEIITQTENYCETIECDSCEFCESIETCFHKMIARNLVKAGLVFQPYVPEARKQVYLNALIRYGDRHQMTVAIEEMGECTQAICKILRGGQDFRHLAEEVADVIICMEQLRMMFNIDDQVEYWMDFKVDRLNEVLKNETHSETQ